MVKKGLYLEKVYKKWLKKIKDFRGDDWEEDIDADYEPDAKSKKILNEFSLKTQIYIQNTNPFYKYIDKGIELLQTMTEKDFFKLPPNFTKTQLRREYNRLAKIHHPDKGGDPKKFKKLQKEYEMLSANK